MRNIAEGALFPIVHSIRWGEGKRRGVGGGVESERREMGWRGGHLRLQIYGKALVMCWISLDRR